jgi:hypothetical protein
MGFKTRDGDVRGESHPSSRLKIDDVLFIRRSKLPVGRLAAMFGVSRQMIRKIRVREAWAWLNNDGTAKKTMPA